jgi:putative transposase
MSFVSVASPSAHGVGQLAYHFEFCPKYRYKCLRQQRFKDFLAGVFSDIAARIRASIVEIGIADDHVHLVVGLRPTHSPSGVLHELKGASARALFKYEPKFRLRYPAGHFWSPGKFYRTIGDVDLETTRAYVRAQDHRQRQLTDYHALAA